MTHPTIRSASQQVSARLEALKAAPSPEAVAALLVEAGATEGPEAWLRADLDESVTVRWTEGDIAVYMPMHGRQDIVHREHLGPDHVLRLFIRAYRAGEYPELLPREGA